jgi:hypothetical protein
MSAPSPADADTDNLAVVLPCTYNPLNPFAAMVAVNELMDGVTDEGTFATTFLDALAINVLPLYVESVTEIVTLVLYADHECGTVTLNEFVPDSNEIVCIKVEPILNSTL